MYFQIKYNGPPEKVIYVISPAHFQEEAEREGWDTSLWEGKANSFTERRGVHPSYGYFIISGEDAEHLIKNDVLDHSTFKKLSLFISSDERNNEGERIVEEIPSLILKEMECITPSYSGKKSFYLITLVDLRCFIPGVDHHIGRKEYSVVSTINGTSSCLTPAELKDKFDLAQEPSFGEFLYDTSDLELWSLGDTLTQPSGARGVYGVKALLKTIFEYFTVNSDVIWPQNYVVPKFEFQNIDLDTSHDVASELEKILFVLGVDLVYEYLTTTNRIRWSVVQIGDDYIPSDGADTNYFEENTSFLLDLEVSGELEKAIDKKFLPETGEMPKSIDFCFPLLSKDNISTSREKYHVITKEPIYAQEVFGKGKVQVEVPTAWTVHREEPSTLHPDSQDSAIDTWLNGLVGGNNGLYLFYELPRKIITLQGFRPILTGTRVARVSWYDLGYDNAGTVVENIIPFRWDKLAPDPEDKDTQRIIYGSVVQKVNTQDKTFQIRNVVTLSGPAPTESILTVRNTSKAGIEANTIVFCLFNENIQEWETFTTSATVQNNEGPGSKLVRFMLKEDLERGEGYAEAYIIDLANNSLTADGNPTGTVSAWTLNTRVNIGDLVYAPTTDPINAPPEWQAGDVIESTADRTTGTVFDATEAQNWTASSEPEAKTIVVVDQEGKRYAFGPYEDPQFGEQDGFIGVAYYLDEEDYAGSGFPGYQIIDMEAEARWIEGPSTGINDEGFTWVEVDKYWGASPNNRPPRVEEYTTPGSDPVTIQAVKVYRRLSEPAPDEDEIVRAVFDDDLRQYVQVSLNIATYHAWARVTEAITAASDEFEENWGSGTVKVQHGTTGVLNTIERAVDNPWIGVSFPEDAQVLIDTTFDPPRVLNGTCANVSWSDTV